MPNRIKLTEKEIDSVIGLFCYESEHGELQGEDKQRTDDFIKQILDDHEKVPRYNDRLGKIQAYCRILQDGDPENENPKEILDKIEKILGDEYYA